MAEGDEKKGGKLTLIIIIVVAVLVIGGGAAAAYFFLIGDDEPVAEEVLEETSVDDTDVAEADNVEDDGGSFDAVYVPMPRAFVFNAPGQRRERLVQIQVELMVRGIEAQTTAQMHIPLIEGTLLQVFSATTAEDLATAEGKANLKFQASKAVQRALKDVTPQRVVEKVLFTGFVMQ